MLALRRRSQPRLLTATRSLRPQERQELVDLATTRGVPADYLRRRLDRYPLVARAFDPAGLAGFQLLDRPGRGADRELVYLGPLVSRSGAYLGLFRDLVYTLVGQRRAFWCAAEIETPRVLESLAALLPTRSFPGRCSRLPLPQVREAFAAFEAALDHLEGYDPIRFTSELRDALSPNAGAAYRLALLGWDGSAQGRVGLLSELEQGYSTFTSRPRRLA